MKRKTFATLLVLIFLAVLMIWSFGSSAANNAGRKTSAPVPESAPNQIFADEDQEEQEADADADLGKHAGGVDREEYLRARDEYIARKRGIEPGRPFNPELRSQAIDQMERQEKGRRLESLVMGGQASPPLFIGGAWTAIGPSAITNGQSLSPGNTAVSGRVTAVVVDPTNSSNVYLGTAQGGVWRSLNGGTTWEAIFDNAESMAIGALALAPSNTSILYVGTGEFNGCGDCFFGTGLYRIEGVNSTPTVIGPINPQQTISNLTYKVFQGRSITKILVHPTDPATIFVSTARGVAGSGQNGLGVVPTIATRGVYRSTNATSAAASVTFQKLPMLTTGSPGNENPATGDVDVVDMVFEPGLDPPNTLLVATGTGAPGIWRTTTALGPSPFFGNVFSIFSSRISLVAIKVGSTVTYYAATTANPNPPSPCNSFGGSVFKSNDGMSWSVLMGGGGFCGGQCFFDIAIAVNPNDANEIYLGGSARGTANQGTVQCSDGMKKSTDGGATFTRDDTGLHADAHSLTYDTAGNIYAGNDGGIFRRKSTPAPGDTTGAGNLGTSWTSLNTSPLSTLQFESIAVHPTDRFLMIGGTQDNGTEFQQTSTGNWSNAEGGDGGYCLIDQSATDTTNVTMYHTFFNQSGTQVGFDRAINTVCLPIKNSWPTRGIGFLASTGDGEQTSIACDGQADTCTMV